ncbi:MAG: TonB C-terminal domain-containing protein [Candidatus Babeliales bacterium]
MLKLQHKKILQLWSSLWSSSERIIGTCLIGSCIIHSIALLALLLTMHEQPLAVFLNTHIDISNIVLVPLAKNMNQLRTARPAHSSPAMSHSLPAGPVLQEPGASIHQQEKIAAPSTGTFLTPLVKEKNKKQSVAAAKKKSELAVQPPKRKTKKELLQEKRAARQAALAEKKKQHNKEELPPKSRPIEQKEPRPEQKSVAKASHALPSTKPGPQALISQGAQSAMSASGPSSASADTESIQSASADEKIYVGLQEWQALQVAQEIQEGIRSAWHPPAGIVPETVCTILVTVAANGAVSDATIQQPSGALMYDIAARNSIYAITFPRSAYGKQVIITFDR